MPLFEYACRECDHQFEALVRASDTPECPSCHSTSLERRLSVFAAHTNASPAAAQIPTGPCGSCGDPRGPGACSMN
jgi:putative FmdB family regulatory protein